MRLFLLAGVADIPVMQSATTQSPTSTEQARTHQCPHHRGDERLGNRCLWGCPGRAVQPTPSPAAQIAMRQERAALVRPTKHRRVSPLLFSGLLVSPQQWCCRQSLPCTTRRSCYSRSQSSLPARNEERKRSQLNRLSRKMCDGYRA